MSMPKRVLLLSAIAVLIGVLTACGQGGSDQSDQTDSNDESNEVYELNFTNVQPANHPTNIAAEWLAEELEKRTDGQVSLTVYPNSELGGPDQIIAGMQVGDVDLAWISSGNLARHIPEFNLFGVSYLIKDNDHYSQVATMGSDMMNELEEIVKNADLGSQLVGMMGGSPRRLFNSERPVHAPEDLKGLSIRIQDSPVEAKVWSALGAQPSPLAWDELYTGLQSGVIDGAEASTSAYETNKFYEVAPYHSLTEHQYMFLPVLMSDKTYEELPGDLRNIVLEAVEEASYKSWEIYWEEEERLVKDLEEQGVEVNEVNTEPFIEIVAPIADDVAKENNALQILEYIRQAGE